MLKTLLCIPPNYCYSYEFPPLGTPMLTGYLKEKGIDVIQKDYNMDYLNYFIKKIFNKNGLIKVPTSTASQIFRCLMDKIFKIKLEKNYYYSSLLPRDHIKLDHINETNASFQFAERLLSSEHLFRYIEDERENTFLQFFWEEKILASLEEQKIKIVGISITAPNQVVGAFTLGYLIKKNLPHVHVTIGGQWVTLYREALKKKLEWNRFFDTMIIFEGETPLYGLITALSENDDLSKVPNLIYKFDSRWEQSKINSKENLDLLACPDFDGLPINDYTASQEDTGLCLTYQTARECYWNKCIYCVDLPLPKQGYRERDADLIIEDIKKMEKKYDLSFLKISNATISPLQMKRFSEKIIETGLDFKWWVMARADEGFNKEIFDLAKRAGCVAIDFGLESACQRVLNFIQKGIIVDTAKRIIKDCHNAGIKVCLQMLIGLPSEKLEEAMDTIQFLIEDRNYISEVVFDNYYLTPACEVYQNPQQCDIDYRASPHLPFKFYYEYSHISGELTKEKGRDLIRLYRQLEAKIRGEEVNNNSPSLIDLILMQFPAHDLSLTVGDDKVSLSHQFKNV